MEVSIGQTHFYDRIWAALIFFTRLPFWRLHQPPKACYETVVEHWPLVGWCDGSHTLWCVNGLAISSRCSSGYRDEAVIDGSTP